MMPGPLSLREREVILSCVMSDPSMSCAAIGRRVGRDRTTVSRELARNGGRGSYSAVAGQLRAEEKLRRPRVPKLVTDSELRRFVIGELTAGFSPAGVSVRAKKRGLTVATDTIYQALYGGVLGLDPKRCLRTGRTRRRSRRAVMTTNPSGNYLGDYQPIWVRPDHVGERIEPGHWEGDLIVGEHKQTAMVTLIERTTRLTHLIALPNGKRSAEVVGTLARWAKTLPPTAARSLTWDQGSELTRWPDLAGMFRDGIFFCDRRAPWQRGTCEQNNKTLRFWFPAGTSLADPTGQRIQHVLNIINNQPRRSLQWQTPNQAYHQLIGH